MEGCTRCCRKAFRSANTNVLMTLSDSVLPSIAATAGYPNANVPLGFTTYNGHPFGAFLLVPAGKEWLLLESRGAWERIFPHARKPPPLLEA
nr:hypothetical protein CFP56_20685 [Quercus suber]